MHHNCHIRCSGPPRHPHCRRCEVDPEVRQDSFDGGADRYRLAVRNCQQVRKRQPLGHRHNRIYSDSGRRSQLHPRRAGHARLPRFHRDCWLSPALRNDATTFPTETIKGKATGCTIGLTSEVLAASKTSVHNTCFWCIGVAIILSCIELSIVEKFPGSALAEWAQYSIFECLVFEAGGKDDVAFSPSNIIFPDSHVVTGPSGQIELVTAGPDAPSVTGSFAGSDGGASSTATFITDETASQLNAQGGSKKGIKSIKFTSGSLSIG